MLWLRTICGCCIIAVLSILSCRVAPEKRTDSIPVEPVDLKRYLGKWYEIARFPHRFEKDLVGVTATYSLRPDGKIEVLNEGFKSTLQGEKKQARGRAWIPDPEMPGLLKVSFFLFFAADYRVIALDRENYEWALVTSGSKDYLWMLCRNPEMDPAVYDRLLETARAFGFDIAKLEKVPQPPARG
jgi:apolipoprotein D and lipocalin family protein